MSSADLLTAGEAARLLGVSTTTIRSYAARGKLTATPLLPGRNGYPRAEVEALLTSPPQPGNHTGRPRTGARWFALAQSPDPDGGWPRHRYLTRREGDETKAQLVARAEALLQPGERLRIIAPASASPSLLRLVAAHTDEA